MPTPRKWKNLLAAAAAPSEEDVARDVSGAMDTVFIDRNLGAPTVDFIPSESEFEFDFRRWHEVLKDVAEILNRLYGTAVFVPTLKFADDTVGLPLHKTMSLITDSVLAAT